MALWVNFWKTIHRPTRVVVADTVDDEPLSGVPLGATLYRADTLEGRVWNGSAWGSSGGGAEGPMGPAGPAGADGSPGADGAPGSDGTDGADGAQGPQGIQGIQGPAGSNGSPGADGAPGLGFSAIVKLSADLAAVTTTALADATGLSFDVVANRSYTFQFWIRFSSAATTTGAQFAVNAPANSYIVYRTETSLTAAAAGAPTFRTANAVNVGTASASVNAANANLLSVIQGMVRPSANGTLIVRCGTEVAASGITVRSGSCGVLYDFGA